MRRLWPTGGGGCRKKKVFSDQKVWETLVYGTGLTNQPINQPAKGRTRQIEVSLDPFGHCSIRNASLGSDTIIDNHNGYCA
jgi:hypothetical protein